MRSLLQVFSFGLCLGLTSCSASGDKTDPGGLDDDGGFKFDAGGGGGGDGGLGGEVTPGEGGTPEGPGCKEATKYIHVVDDANVLYKFDPTVATTAAFTRIGPIDCTGGGSPNSMAIGRDGFAYVSYGTDDPLTGSFNCGGMYKVNIETAACAGKTSFKCGSSGFDKFGMGFATDAPGVTNDSLYLSNSLDAQLGKVDLGTGKVTALGALPNQGGEFTGNQNAELWGFFPYQNPPEVHQIDKSNGKSSKKFTLPSLPSLATATGGAWAFAYWAGAFYVFYDVEPTDSSTNVYKLTLDGKLTKYIPNTKLKIVGAGVSTCAPTSIK